MEQNVAHRKIGTPKSEFERRRLELQTGSEARFLPAMPITVRYSPGPVTVTCAHSVGEMVFSMRSPGPLVGRLGLSAYALRTAFLNVKDPTEALDFLLLSAPFRYDGKDDDDGAQLTSRTYLPLTWSEFKGWQELVRIKMERGTVQRRVIQEFPEKRMSSDFDVPDHLNELLIEAGIEGWRLIEGWPDGIVFRFDKPPSDPSRAMRAEIFVSSSLEAISAACYIDTLIGVQYVLCAGRDCNNLFQIKSNHAREYCSQACAHKASVRRRRAEAKKLKEAAAKRTTKSKAKKGKG